MLKRRAGMYAKDSLGQDHSVHSPVRIVNPIQMIECSYKNPLLGRLQEIGQREKSKSSRHGK